MRVGVTKLPGIKYPIIQAPTGPMSVLRRVAVVSNASGLGILNAGHFAPEEKGEDIGAVGELIDKPFGVNLTAGTPGCERLAEAPLAKIGRSFASVEDLFVPSLERHARAPVPRALLWFEALWVHATL